MRVFASKTIGSFAMVMVFFQWSDSLVRAQQVPAMFVFGDSLVDVGNNNFLNTIAKSNFLPYGVDFSGGPTGRFSNGRTLVDMLGGLLGLPPPPAFANPTTVGTRIQQGVNYASAAAGILEESGQHYGQRHTLILVFGSNDYINNYLMPSIYPSSFQYNPQQFANLLLNRYTRQILALHSVGLRKFFIGGVGPLGCIPNQRSSGQAPPGRCVDSVNQMLGTFNEGLRSIIDQLNRNHPGAIFIYGNIYNVFGDILNNPAIYGFNVIDRACCGIGRNRGQITCLPYQVPCLNRNQFLFWDAFHPTQAATAIIAWRVYNGPPNDVYPINVQQMALL
ncbi:GDSL esterase/lipase [Quillaja saponaria]|uniref:GDSL esterase/lipase n=1 Tax=Quillaja saponaria TaxID=32244 RepID=A0AAD7L189_QUISA|nr:GDSL esterase/lipase [Quillaja saponaria]